MNEFKTCPFGDTEHFPRIETQEMDEPFPDGDKWGALAICDEHAYTIMGFGKTEAESLNDLQKRWNTRPAVTLRLVIVDGEERIEPVKLG